MATLRIKGNIKLKGDVPISGSKNAALPIIASAILTDKQVVLHHVPRIDDVEAMVQVLEELGSKIKRENSSLVISPAIKKVEASYHLVKKMRASFYVAGPLLGRMRRADVPLPGGCVIGSRPVDFHIQAFSQMGAKVKLEHGYMKAKASKLHGAKIYLDPRYCSVGTTINIILGAVLARGKTVIENAARDPEIVDLVSFLSKMGAVISGAGTSTIEVEGVKKLSGCEHTVVGDRMEAGTYLIAAAVTRGQVTAKGCPPEYLRLLLSRLAEMGFSIRKGKNWIRLNAEHIGESTDIVTAPYPGFPTDLQPPFVVLLALCRGTSVVEETIHDSRFRYAGELRRMGANIKRVENSLVIQGPSKLTGAPVEATDLRAGAALVIAALSAQGKTDVLSIDHVHRGYESFQEKLTSLGAKFEQL